MTRSLVPKTPDEVRAFVTAHAPWTFDGEALSLKVSLADFASAMGLAVQIGCMAEKRDHHPDLEVRYGHLGVRLVTHDVGGVSDRDFELAREISMLLARGRGA